MGVYGLAPASIDKAFSGLLLEAVLKILGSAIDCS